MPEQARSFSAVFLLTSSVVSGLLVQFNVSSFVFRLTFSDVRALLFSQCSVFSSVFSLKSSDVSRLFAQCSDVSFLFPLKSSDVSSRLLQTSVSRYVKYSIPFRFLAPKSGLTIILFAASISSGLKIPSEFVSCSLTKTMNALSGKFVLLIGTSAAKAAPGAEAANKNTANKTHTFLIFLKIPPCRLQCVPSGRAPHRGEHAAGAQGGPASGTPNLYPRPM